LTSLYLFPPQSHNLYEKDPYTTLVFRDYHAPTNLPVCNPTQEYKRYASITHLTSPLRTSLLVTNPTYPWPSHQDHPFKSICTGPLPLHYRLALPKCRQGKTCSRPPDGNSLPPSATLQVTLLFVAYRLVEHPLPTNATPVNHISTSLGTTTHFLAHSSIPIIQSEYQIHIITVHMPHNSSSPFFSTDEA